MPRRYLFINASAKKDGSTVECGTALLEGLESEQIHLVDYRIGFFGQSFDDDEFDAVLEKMLAADGRIDDGLDSQRRRTERGALFGGCL